MDYSLSWFTAWMPTPRTYLMQILGYIPDTLDFIYHRISQPAVVIGIIITLVLTFIYALTR